MRIESEKTLERRLKSSVEKDLGGLCLKLLSTHFTGLPDRLCLIPGGLLFFAEIKTTRKNPKKIQILVHNTLRALGFRVETIDSSDQIKKIIADYE